MESVDLMEQQEPFQVETPVVYDAPATGRSNVASDQDFRRIRLESPLPCGMSGCQREAHSALAERNDDGMGLWRVLPICPTCFTRM